MYPCTQPAECLNTLPNTYTWALAGLEETPRNILHLFLEYFNEL